MTLGAAPEGVTDPQSAARAVRAMFTSIAPRYDLLNHLFSSNIDRLWWRKTARAFANILSRPESQVLDLCCGTGDMTLALRRQAGNGCPQNPGCRFFPRHAPAGRPESGRHPFALDRGRCPAPAFSRRPFRSDHLRFRFSQPGQITMPDCGRSSASCAPAGKNFCILDFGEPEGLVGNCYRLYFKRVLPGRSVHSSQG